MAKINRQNTSEVDATDFFDVIDKYKLSKLELRQALRPAAQYLFAKEQSALGKGWGIRTGRLSREGLKIGVSARDETNGGAYRIYFSKKSGPRGTDEYMADTYKARWLEGGTKPHYTAKGATRKKRAQGRLRLNSRQRRLMHPGFKARPVVETVVKQNEQDVKNIVMNNLLPLLKKKGAEDGDES
ncbi:putative tail completion protein [Serratia phage vB_SmaS_PhooPhighters]|uniref:Uncharacterized protein n=1 Tax=Serratia phage vB_SmaS_Rovert TaxID=2777363 RepID=A0A7T3NA06_9CAUD|nr:hypothetical protein QJS24_gp08 [Serratia phage vB_SmaS_Rovert]QPX74976.1 hypothetical protein [Serratia phage vB_SmaS_Rovert]UGO51949.1 putative tail completion protein [Serratia phage vB_SmaS_PhooPhighters]